MATVYNPDNPDTEVPTTNRELIAVTFIVPYGKVKHHKTNKFYQLNYKG